MKVNITCCFPDCLPFTGHGQATAEPARRLEIEEIFSVRQADQTDLPECKLLFNIHFIAGDAFRPSGVLVSMKGL